MFRRDEDAIDCARRKGCGRDLCRVIMCWKLLIVKNWKFKKTLIRKAAFDDKSRITKVNVVAVGKHQC